MRQSRSTLKTPSAMELRMVCRNASLPLGFIGQLNTPRNPDQGRARRAPRPANCLLYSRVRSGVSPL
jgi:hypothetical protein